MAVEAQQPAAPARPRPKREREEEVLVWPDLVFVEFIASILFTITFLILSVLVNAPLLNRANSELTPNPSKAPWYFLNLQELLLHMDKAWAGVLLPTIALMFFMIIPYVDRSREAQGVWFGTSRSVRLTVVAAIYALVVSAGLVIVDAGDTNVSPIPGAVIKTENLTAWIPSCDNTAEYQTTPCLKDEEGTPHQGIISTKDFAKRLQFSFPVPDGIFGGPTDDGRLNWPEDLDHIPVPGNNIDCCYGSIHLWEGMHLNVPTIMAEQVIPLSTIFVLTLAILYALFRVGWLRTRRDLFIVMFTCVMVSYLVLSMIGSFFRGPGQALINPVDIKVDEG
jgi:quinol-cytochrome oxidoreductase complex cytochrome b subunit